MVKIKIIFSMRPLFGLGEEGCSTWQHVGNWFRNVIENSGYGILFEGVCRLGSDSFSSGSKADAINPRIGQERRRILAEP